MLYKWEAGLSPMRGILCVCYFTLFFQLRGCVRWGEMELWSGPEGENKQPASSSSSLYDKLSTIMITITMIIIIIVIAMCSEENVIIKRSRGWEQTPRKLRWISYFSPTSPLFSRRGCFLGQVPPFLQSGHLGPAIVPSWWTSQPSYLPTVVGGI